MTLDGGLLSTLLSTLQPMLSLSAGRSQTAIEGLQAPGGTGCLNSCRCCSRRLHNCLSCAQRFICAPATIHSSFQRRSERCSAPAPMKRPIIVDPALAFYALRRAKAATFALSQCSLQIAAAPPMLQRKAHWYVENFAHHRRRRLQCENKPRRERQTDSHKISTQADVCQLQLDHFIRDHS